MNWADIHNRSIHMFRSAVFTVQDELRKTWRTPGRVAKLLDLEKLANLFAAIFTPGKWVEVDGTGTRVRKYRSYLQYLKHQQSKRALVLRSDYDEVFRAALRKRLQQDSRIKPGMSVLCLGARSGAEVRAFADLGCFAVGTDVKPTPLNAYVLHGDFQHLQWGAECVDVVYTNALDHAFDISAVLDEVQRVLRRNGIFIVEAVRGSKQAHPPGPWGELLLGEHG